eukprot:5339486-Karenia_brevis.AAC.1
MSEAGVAFRPMVWSAEGRSQPVVRRVFGFAAELAQRKTPLLSKRAFLKRWEREIAVALQRRLANMIQACLPRPSARSEWLATGQCPAASAWPSPPLFNEIPILWPIVRCDQLHRSHFS